MKLYLKNSSFGILQLFFSMLIVFFSIPIFIHTYGLSLYGVFSIISIFGNLTLLFNLGLNTTLLKFISENNTEYVRNAQVSVSFVLLAAVTIIFSLLFLLFQNYIIGDFFNIDPVIRPQVVCSFRLFIISNVFIMLGQPFVALIQANNDYYKTSTIQWIFNLINGIGLILISKLSAPFSFIALPALVSSIVWFVLLYYYSTSKYKLKLFRFSEGFVFTNIVKQQFKYSLQVYLISLLSFFNEPLLKILVARYLGAAAVGSFDIILRVKGQLVGLLTKMFEPLSTIIASKKEKYQIRNIVHSSEQLAVLAFIPLSLMIWYFADPFLKMWLKEISSTMIICIKLSVVIFTFSMVVLPNFYYLIYHGKMRQCTVIQITGIIVSLLSLFTCIYFNKEQTQIPVISVCSGIVAAFIVNISFQQKYLQSVIFDRSTFVPMFTLGLFSFLFFITKETMPVLRLFLIFPCIVVSCFTIYKMKRTGILNFLN